MPEQSPVFQRRWHCSRGWTRENQSPKGCCGCMRLASSGRVAPLPGEYGGYEIIEVRAGRFLRVVHIQPNSACSKGHPINTSSVLDVKQTATAFSSSNKQQHHPYRTLSEDECKNGFGVPHDHTTPTKSATLPARSSKDLLETSLRDLKTVHNSSSFSHSSSPKHSKQFQIRAGSAVENSPRWKHSNYQAHSSLPPLSPSGKRISTASGVHCHMETQGHNNAAFANDHDTEVQSIDGDAPRETMLSSSPMDHNSFIASPLSTCSPNHRPSGDATAQTKPVIFLIHGVGGSADVWQAQIDYFSADGYEIVAPDFVGHGFSCAPKQSAAYDFSEIKRDTLSVFDRYRKSQNIVIGHSYGASFAAVLARQRAPCIQKLIMISGGSPTPLAPQPGLFSLPMCMLYCCWPVMRRGFKKSAFHDPNKSYISQEYAFDIPTYVLKHTMNGQNWLEGDDTYHKWITAPTLLIHGREDQLITIEEEQEMQETLEDCELVIVDQSSHMVMLEKPHEVNKLINDFITDTVITSTFSSPIRRRQDPLNQSIASLKSVKSIPSNLIVNSLSLKRQ